MEVHLIRHTTPAIQPGICYGRSDIPVDQTRFPAELEAIHAKLPNNITRWYSSPLQRCMVLAEALHPTPTADERLMELDFGDWEKRPWEQVPRTELDPWMNDFVHAAPPKGESFAALHGRTEAFLETLFADPQPVVGIVTHAGNIRSFCAWALDLPLTHAFRVELPYGAVVTLRLERAKEHCRILGIR